MKKYIFKTAICAALALPLTTACELDQLPEGTITTEQSWEKVEDANNYYVGLLSNLRQCQQHYQQHRQHPGRDYRRSGVSRPNQGCCLLRSCLWLR